MRSLRLSTCLALVGLTTASLAQDNLFDAPVRNPGQTQLCNPCIDVPVSYPRNNGLTGSGTGIVITAEQMRSSIEDMINVRRNYVLGTVPGDCPRTDVSAAPALRVEGSDRDWYGTSSLTVSLLPDPVYSNSATLRWTSDALRPYLIDEFSVSVRRIGEGAATAVSRTIVGEQTGDRWELLTQIRFSGPGCWQVTGNFQGQSLIFVAESLDL